jgi:hypothetical protein
MKFPIGSYGWLNKNIGAVIWFTWRIVSKPTYNATGHQNPRISVTWYNKMVDGNKKKLGEHFGHFVLQLMGFNIVVL